MSNSGNGKRKLIRAPFNNHVMINRVMRFRATDISEGGIYVHTGRSFFPGSIVDVSFVLNKITYNVSAIVQHNEAGIGMGLMFRSLSNKERDRIRSYIKQMSQRVLKKKKILIIYDLIPLTMQRSALVRKGYAVNEINESHKFLSTAIENSPIDMIILILNLISEQETEVIHLLNGCEAYGCVPVLLISDNRATEVVNRIIDAGAFGFISRATAAPKKVVEMVEGVFKQTLGGD